MWTWTLCAIHFTQNLVRLGEEYWVHYFQQGRSLIYNFSLLWLFLQKCMHMWTCNLFGFRYMSRKLNILTNSLQSSQGLPVCGAQYRDILTPTFIGLFKNIYFVNSSWLAIPQFGVPKDWLPWFKLKIYLDTLLNGLTLHSISETE